MRAKRSRSRANPPGLDGHDPVEALRSAIEEVGGARWAIVTSFRYSAAFLNKWADETGVGGDLLVLTHHADSNPGRSIVGRIIPSAGTHAKVTAFVNEIWPPGDTEIWPPCG